MADSSVWSELPPDLLVQIFSRLELVDFIRAAAACRSWRQLKLRSKDFHVPPQNQIPWLMLSSPSPSQTQSRYFHSLLSSSDTHEIRLPEIAGRFCIGSSEGFLISADQATADLHAINPVTGAHIPLPPTSTIADIGALNTQDFWFRKAIVSPDSGFWFRKAIVSPDPGFGGGPRTAAVICSFDDNIVFARPGDGKWTRLGGFRITTFLDIVFHKKRLLVVNWKGDLDAFNLEDPSVPHSRLCEGFDVSCWPMPDDMCYLVESPDGHDLYCVTRSIGFFWQGDDDDDDDDDDQEGEYIHRTTSFQVFKLDELERRWIEVNTLGDLALFLGFNHSLALSATGHPSIKRNSIYFTDDYPESYFDMLELPRDMGVFDVGDGSIQPLSLSDDLLRLNWPPPIWFTPALS